MHRILASTAASLLFIGVISVLPFAAIAQPAGAILAHKEGKTLIGQKRLKDGIVKLEQAVQLAPKYGAAWADLGHAYLGARSFSKAVSAFESAIAAQPSLKNVRYNYAYALRKAKRFAQAADQYRLHIKTTPNDPDAYYGLAESLKAAGKNAEAAAAFDGYARAEKRPGKTKWIAKAQQEASALRGAAPPTSPAVASAAPVPAGDTPAVPVAKPAPKKRPKLRLKKKTPPAGAAATVASPAPEAKKADPVGKAGKGTMRFSFSDKPTPTEAGAGATDASAKTAMVKTKSPRPPAFRTALTQLQKGDYAAATPTLEALSREHEEDGMIWAALAAAYLGSRAGGPAERAYLRAIGTAGPDALPGLYLGLGEASRMLGKDKDAIAAYERARTHELAPKSIQRLSAERIAALK